MTKKEIEDKIAELMDFGSLSEADSDIVDVLLFHYNSNNECLTPEEAEDLNEIYDRVIGTIPF